MALISIVIPVFNEEDCVEVLFERLKALQTKVSEELEFIFVDDGSSDRSKEIILELSEKHSSVKHVCLSRNFGHEIATTAGIDHASGDAVVIIDADLQDSPEVIPQMIEKWQGGYHVVYGQRTHRHGESVIKKISSWLFYRIIQKLSDTDIPVDTGDFRLMDRDVVDQLRRCREHDRFVRGLVAWTGFRQIGIPYKRDERLAGQTKYSFGKLLALAVDVVIGFSTVPLRVGILTGLFVTVACVIMAIVILLQKVLLNMPVEGYALLMTSIFFLGGVQLFVIGLMGEYIGRIYRQSQNRPLYIVEQKSETLPPDRYGWADIEKRS